MKITPMMLGILFGTSVLLGMASFYGDVQDSYSLTNSTPESSFFTFNETVGKLNTTASDLEQKAVGMYRKGILDRTKYTDAIMAFVDVGIIILQMPGILTTNVDKINTMLPGFVPAFFTFMIMTAIVLIIVLRVVALVTKSDEI